MQVLHIGSVWLHAGQGGLNLSPHTVFPVVVSTRCFSRLCETQTVFFLVADTSHLSCSAFRPPVVVAMVPWRRPSHAVGVRIAIAIFEGAEELDWVGQWEVFDSCAQHWPDDAEIHQVAGDVVSDLFSVLGLPERDLEAQPSSCLSNSGSGWPTSLLTLDGFSR